MNERSGVNGAHIPTGIASSVILKKLKIYNYLRGTNVLFSG
jgi:hypothetical protein